jgi:hypothetical protein
MLKKLYEIGSKLSKLCTNLLRLFLFIAATTLSITTLSTTTFSIMRLSIKGLFVTSSINDTQHHGTRCGVLLF